MRLNKLLAHRLGISRRAADNAILDGRVSINNQQANPGIDIINADSVLFDSKPLPENPTITTIMLNKPIGYVCSRNGQGSKTVYDLLPPEFKNLKPVGRLDKDSSGLLLMTNDGNLANQLTHPRYQKQKIYQVTLDKPLLNEHKVKIESGGVSLSDGVSKFTIKNNGQSLKVTLQEGRNRQIRRTFEKLGYKVAKLHRTNFGHYVIATLSSEQYKIIS